MNELAPPAKLAPDLAGDRARDRLHRVDWTFRPECFRSHAALAKEYLRRAALWADALNLPPDVDPLEDWSARLSGSSRDFTLPPLPEPPEGLPSVTGEGVCDSAGRMGLSVESARVIRYWLRWIAVCESPLVRRHNRPDPYEPLIRLLERGGRFRRDNGFLRVGVAGVVLRTWRMRAAAEPLALTDRDLDLIDDPNQPERE